MALLALLRSSALRLVLSSCALAAAGLVSATPAYAQSAAGLLLGSEIPGDYDRGRNVSVLERDRPEYQALGIRSGGFTIYPRVETGVGYLDNIFATQNNTVGAGYFVFDPTITAQSNWSRNALSVTAGAALREFFTHSTENENGLSIQADGRVDIDRSDIAYLSAFSRQAYEPRSDGGFPVGAAAPVEYVQSGFSGRLAHEGGRLRAIVAGDFDYLNYMKVAAIGGGFIDQNNRDEAVGRISGRLEYGVTPGVASYGQFTYSRSSYTQALAPGVPNRDSEEYRVLAGGNFDLTALVRGQVALGYVSRQYDSPVFRSLSGLAANAVVEYFPTQLTTLTLSARRLIQDAVTIGSGGYFNNGVNVRVDHELLRNLLLNAAIDYEQDDYDGIPTSAHVIGLSGGARYFLTRSIGLNAQVDYENRRDSGGAGIETPLGRSFRFSATSFVLSVVFQR